MSQERYESPLSVLTGWRAAVLALALVAAAIALRFALGFRGGDTPIGVMFVIPVVVAARYAGRTGGLAATAAVAVGTKLFLFMPTGSLAFASGTVFLHWLLLVLVGLIATVLVDDVRRAHLRAVQEAHEKRRLEAQVHQAQRLESVGRLAGGIAHDFNNLVGVVLSSAEVLREDARAGRGTDPDVVDEISGAGERARELTRRLLTFARRQAVHPVPVELGALVTRGEALLRRLLGEGVRLVVRLPRGEDVVVRADPVQLEQVLFNLAGNARDAMPRGGVLTVEVLAREGGEEPGHPEGRWAVLAVRDDGVGMTPEVQARAFEPFFTTKEPGKGTGLGLATVHGIVSQAGGHVHLRSAPGAGTELRLCLPRCDARPEEAGAPAA